MRDRKGVDLDGRGGTGRRGRGNCSQDNRGAMSVVGFISLLYVRVREHTHTLTLAQQAVN